MATGQVKVLLGLFVSSSLMMSCGGSSQSSSSPLPPPPAACASAAYFPRRQGWLRHFEQFAANLNNEEEKAEWELLATAYRERAQTIQRMVGKVRESFANDGPRNEG